MTGPVEEPPFGKWARSLSALDPPRTSKELSVDGGCAGEKSQRLFPAFATSPDPSACVGN